MTIAVPRKVWIEANDGLHPRSLVAAEMDITGAMVSVVQVAVLLITVELPQLSMAVKIRVVPLVHPVLNVLSVTV